MSSSGSMLTQRLANIIFAIVLIGACVWFAMIAESFQAAGLLASAGLPSKFFPQLLLGFTGLCATVVALQYVIKGQSGGDAGGTVFTDLLEASRGILVMAVAIACFFIWQRYGFIPMALMMGPLSLMVMGVRILSHYLIVLMLTALVYLVFTKLLSVPLT